MSADTMERMAAKLAKGIACASVPLGVREPGTPDLNDDLRSFVAEMAVVRGDLLISGNVPLRRSANRSADPAQCRGDPLAVRAATIEILRKYLLKAIEEGSAADAESAAFVSVIEDIGTRLPVR